MKRRMITCLLGVLVVVTGCSSGVGSTPEESRARGVGSPQAAKVGQPLTVRGSTDRAQLEVVVTRVVNARSTDDFSLVDQGMRLIAVQFRLVNTGSDEYYSAPWMGATVVDTRARQYGADIMSHEITAGRVFPALVKIPPEKRALGFLTFHVPAKATVVQVQFSMSSEVGDAGHWNIRLKPGGA